MPGSLAYQPNSLTAGNYGGLLDKTVNAAEGGLLSRSGKVGIEAGKGYLKSQQQQQQQAAPSSAPPPRIQAQGPVQSFSGLSDPRYNQLPQLLGTRRKVIIGRY
jgi:hypothetical protein